MDTEEEARKAWARPLRGDDRVHIEIEGSRIVVSCKGDVIRVVLKRPEGGSQVETDLVSLVEVHTWRRGKLLSDYPATEGDTI